MICHATSDKQPCSWAHLLQFVTFVSMRIHHLHSQAFLGMSASIYASVFWALFSASPQPSASAPLDQASQVKQLCSDAPNLLPTLNCLVGRAVGTVQDCLVNDKWIWFAMVELTGSSPSSRAHTNSLDRGRPFCCGNRNFFVLTCHPALNFCCECAHVVVKSCQACQGAVQNSANYTFDVFVGQEARLAGLARARP